MVSGGWETCINYLLLRARKLLWKWRSIGLRWKTAATYLADEDTGIDSSTRVGVRQRCRIVGCRTASLGRSRAGGSLIVEPGSKPGPGETPVEVGVPYGSRARLILFYLQTEALRTGRREIELGRSLRVWLHPHGDPVGGKSVAGVRAG